MIILYILKLIGIILLALILLLLFVPFKYSFLARKYEKATLKAYGSWLFGLAQFCFSKEFGAKSKIYLKIIGINFKMKPEKNKHSIKRLSKNSKKDNKPSKNKLRFLEKDFIKPVIKAIKELFNHIKPTKFKLEGRYGFEDPFYTGIALSALNILNPLFKNYNVSATAVFDEEVLEGNFHIKGRLIIFIVLIIALKAFLNKNFRNILLSKEEKSYVS